MAPMRFANAIAEGTPIYLFNEGRHSREFTYIDDIVEEVLRASDRPAEADPDWSGNAPDPAASDAPWRIYNIGNSDPVDVPYTLADLSQLKQAIHYRPQTSLEDGLKAFVAWHRTHCSA